MVWLQHQLRLQQCGSKACFGIDFWCNPLCLSSPAVKREVIALLFPTKWTVVKVNALKTEVLITRKYRKSDPGHLIRRHRDLLWIQKGLSPLLGNGVQLEGGRYSWADSQVEAFRNLNAEGKGDAERSGCCWKKMENLHGLNWKRQCYLLLIFFDEGSGQKA